MGLKEYVVKNGFEKVVLGLSGGIDSALTAAIAVEALGAAERGLRVSSFKVHLGRERGGGGRSRAQPGCQAPADSHRGGLHRLPRGSFR